MVMRLKSPMSPGEPGKPLLERGDLGGWNGSGHLTAVIIDINGVNDTTRDNHLKRGITDAIGWQPEHVRYAGLAHLCPGLAQRLCDDQRREGIVRSPG